MRPHTTNRKLPEADRPPNGSPRSARHVAPPLDQAALLGLLGYNCRRAYLRILALFRERMVQFDLRPVDFSVLVLVRANPHVNQKRLAHTLGIDPPNLATLLDRLEARQLIARERNPKDMRTQQLVLTPEGKATCGAAEKVVTKLEAEATPKLTQKERGEMMRLAQKIFLH